MATLIKLRSDVKPQPPRRRHPFLRLVFVASLVVFAALLAERLRGQWALSHYKQQMSAKGEVFEPERIWPIPSPEALTFSNQYHTAVAQLPKKLERYAGRLSPIVLQGPGIARRGSQEPSLVLANQSTEELAPEPATWGDLEVAVREAQPALQSLRSGLKNPPANMGYAITPALGKLEIPNFVPVRRAAQALQAAAISDLHRGDLASAKDDLVALAAFTRLYAEDPTLVNYMIRIAVLGLSIDSAWDALQANGWTDEQLAELQQAFQCEDMLAQLPRTREAERAWRLVEFNWFASHSYFDWVERYKEFWQCFGEKLPDSPLAVAERYYREWVFHPVWKFAWADQEQLEFLQHVQQELEILREGVTRGAGHELTARLTSFHESYQPPVASWRFYLYLPMADQMPSAISVLADKRQYPYPIFTRAWSTSMKNLTLSQMLTAAIALKRYELRHGKAPSSLDGLIPELLAKAPRDFMTGQELHYVPRRDGSWCLYSVAEDGKDDLGRAVAVTDSSGPPSAWNGRDWVWPRVAPVRSGAQNSLAVHKRQP